ncbi:hypothetical protein ACJMK2_004556 [Sinanodonta woodiana]|uniref:G-protein coupled receptors family 1 profile domain-containing protein n=1 Tax=Sinanodonta woodiana TaxID=1069815 RepID=A0ABD3Y3I3_SINWO
MENMSIPTVVSHNTTEDTNFSTIHDETVQAVNVSMATLSHMMNMKDQMYLILIPSMVLTSLFMVVGIPGNMLVIVIYCFTMRRRRSKKFIILLAIPDIINCCFAMPVEIAILTNFWDFDNPILCKVSRFSTFLMNNITSFVLLGIAIDRYRTICRPLKPKFNITDSKVAAGIAFLIAVSSAFPALLIYGTYQPTPGQKTCLIDSKMESQRYPFIFTMFIFTGNIIIFVTLSILYVLVGRKVCRGKHFGSEQKIALGLKCTSFTVSAHSYTDMGDSHRTGAVRRTQILKGIQKRPSRAYSVASCQTPNPILCKQCACKHEGVRPRSGSAQAIMGRNRGNQMGRKHGGIKVRAGRTTLMIFIVTLCFVLSFVPYLVIVTLRYVIPDLKMTFTEKSLYNFFLRSYFMNSAVNPIIYGLVNQQFRREIKRLFCRCIKKRKPERDLRMLN